MHRMLAATLVIVVCVIAGQAQQGDQQRKLLTITKDGEKTVWTVSGSGQLSHLEMLEAYVEASEKKILFAPNGLGEFGVHAPRSGITLTGQQIDMFVATALGEIHYGVVERSEGILEVVRGTEAIAEGSAILTPEELATADPSRLVSCLVHLDNLEPNSVAGVFRTFIGRGFGTVNPVQGVNAVVIGERCFRAKEIVAAIQKLDESMRREAKFYALPAGANLKKAGNTINALFNDRGRPGQSQTSIVAAPDEHRHGLLVMAPARVHGEIEEAVRAFE